MTESIIQLKILDSEKFFELASEMPALDIKHDAERIIEIIQEAIPLVELEYDDIPRALIG